MRPPYRIELWTKGNPQILNVTMSVEAAERVHQEAVAKLRTGEAICVRDTAGALVFSSSLD